MRGQSGLPHTGLSLHHHVPAIVGGDEPIDLADQLFTAGEPGHVQLLGQFARIEDRVAYPVEGTDNNLDRHRPRDVPPSRHRSRRQHPRRPTHGRPDRPGSPSTSVDTPPSMSRPAATAPSASTTPSPGEVKSDGIPAVSPRTWVRTGPRMSRPANAPPRPTRTPPASVSREANHIANPAERITASPQATHHGQPPCNSFTNAVVTVPRTTATPAPHTAPRARTEPTTHREQKIALRWPV